MTIATAFPALMTQTLTVLQPAVKVLRSGAQIPDWDNPTVAATVGGAVQGRTGKENLTDRDAAISQWRVYLPAGTVVERGWRIGWAGRTLEVVAVPRPVYHQLTGVLHHWEADAKEVLG